MSALDMGCSERTLFTTVKQHLLTDTKVCLNELIQFLVGVTLKMLYCAEKSCNIHRTKRNLKMILFKVKTYIFKTVEDANSSKTTATIKIPKLTDHSLPDLSLSFPSDRHIRGLNGWGRTGG